MSKPCAWQEVTFLEKIELNHKVKLNKGQMYPFIDMPSVGVGMRAPEKIKYKEYNGSGVRFCKHDTLIARIEPCLQNGKRFFFREGEVGFGSTEYAVFSPKDSSIDPEFLYYFLNQERINKRFEAALTGTSGRRRMDTSFLASYVISIPDIQTQKNIASVLSALDDKIELNNQLIEVLEDQVQQVYDYWFMQFDFPDANGKPYRSSGGKMVWNEMLKNELPDGWKISELQDIIETNPSIKISKGTSAPYIELDTLSANRYLTGLSARREYNGGGMKFCNGDVLLVRITPSLENGKTGLVHDLPEGVAGFGSTEYIVMRGRNMPLSAYCITLARSPKFRAYAISKMRGTSGRKRLDYHDVDAYKIALPPDAVLRDFESICTPLLERIHIAMVENHELAAERDFLLPQLMTGEITVAD